MSTSVMSRGTERGFTLAEVVVAIAVLAVLVGIAVPSLRWFMVNQQVRNASFDLSTALILARSEATRRNTSVVVDQAEGGWQNGWRIIVAGSDEPLRVQPPYRDIVIASDYANVTFTRHGRIGNIEDGRLPRFDVSSVVSDSRVKARCIGFDSSGRVTTSC